MGERKPPRVIQARQGAGEKNKARIELIEIKQAPVNIFLPNLLAHLTEKQRNALEAAVREGYYDFPRRISLDQLARKLGVPRTTLQSHLRKAEGKLLHALLQQTTLSP